MLLARVKKHIKSRKNVNKMLKKLYEDGMYSKLDCFTIRHFDKRENTDKLLLALLSTIILGFIGGVCLGISQIIFSGSICDAKAFKDIFGNPFWGLAFLLIGLSTITFTLTIYYIFKKFIGYFFNKKFEAKNFLVIDGKVRYL